MTLKNSTPKAKAKLKRLHELADRFKRECSDGDYTKALSTYAEIGTIMSERVNTQMVQDYAR